MPRPVVALITAYNEASTIGGVVDAVLAAGLVDRVQVVDDASTDGTAEIAAARPGVRLIRLPERVPLGSALLSHLQHVEESDAVLFFCDADLVGLTAAHVDAVVAPVLHGRAGMAVGLRDKRMGRAIRWLTEKAFPRVDLLIGGERALYREIADSVLGGAATSGYGLQTVMNRFCRRHRIPVRVVYMDGCDHRQKFRKWSPLDAAAGMVRLIGGVMGAQILTLFPGSIPPRKFGAIPELGEPEP